MSVRVQGWVWDQDFTTSELVVALKLADHADHDGGNIYPRVAEIAQKTKLSERQVKRYLSDFVRRGILVIEDHAAGGRGHARVYRFTFAFAAKSDTGDALCDGETVTPETPFVEKNRGTDDTLYDDERVTPTAIKGDSCDTERVTSTAIKGDIHARAKQNRPEPSKEPSKNHPHTPTPLERRFEQFWSVYPRKTAKLRALDRWKKLKPDDALTARMVAAVEAQKQSPAWRRDDGQYIPHPATWLHDGRWEDEEQAASEPPKRRLVVG